MKENLDLQIDELVLNGFAAADGQAIGEAVERELARLMMEQGTPQGISKEGATAELKIGSLQIRTGGDAHTIGAELAKAIYGGFGE